MITFPEKYNENNIKKIDLDFNAKYVENSSNIGSFFEYDNKMWLGNNLVKEFVEPNGNIKKYGNIKYG